jgi:hypothetical protein
MSVSGADLGEIENLAKAIGLLRPDGFNPDWLADPEGYLASILSDDGQRAALLAFVDSALGGGERRTDANGQIWLPLFESASPPIAFHCVVDERQPDHIRIGLGVRATSAAPQAALAIHVPLFKAARGTGTVADPILLGRPGGRIQLVLEATVDSGTPAPGASHLRSVGVVLDVPTDGTAPDFGITLAGLRLPGADRARDIILSLATLDTLDDIVLELALGLIQAQAGQAGGQIQALARLLGLSPGTGIPALPLEQIGLHGARALGDWAHAIFASATARGAWLAELAALLGNGAQVVGGRVALDVGIARVSLGIDVEAGTGGAPLLTPRLAIETGAAGAVARIEAALMRLDLGARSAVALPALDALLLLGRHDGAGTPLLAGDPAIEGLRFGIRLGEDRRLAATLALVNVTIGSNPLYPLLDLSSPAAVAAGAGQVIDDLADQALAGLGPVKDMIARLIGLDPPSGVPGVSISGLLADPLGALRGYWRTLVTLHAGEVPGVLLTLRDLIAHGGVAGTPVGGTGSGDDPWTVPLAGRVTLRIAAPAGGTLVSVALAAGYANDQLGERCTRLEADIAATLLSVDLAGGPAAFLPSASFALRGRPRGSPRVSIGLAPLRLSAAGIGLIASWSPHGGLRLGFTAPDPELAVDGAVLPLDFPDLSAGLAGLGDSQWDAIELIAGLLAQQSPGGWLGDLAIAAGWVPEPGRPFDPDRPRLRLARLVAAPEATLLAWARSVLLSAAPRLEALLRPLARILTGTAGASGALAGLGTVKEPYRLALLGAGQAPALAFWLPPDGPPLEAVSAVGDMLRAWRPGLPGLAPSALGEALARESTVAEDVAGLVAGRSGIALGLSHLIERLAGTDGRVLVPATAPAGTTLHVLEGIAANGVAAALDLGELFDPEPSTVLRIRVVDSAGEGGFADRAGDRLIDLTAPSLAPETFALPAAAAGEWWVALGTRAAARLAGGDAEGIAGQAARLRRIIEPFRALGGGLVLVAEGGAGHAARLAAEAVPEVTGLVTLGTPAGPVAFSVLAAEPAASTLRLLDALIPDEPDGEEEEPFDEDLERGRDLVRGLLELAARPGAADELAPPALAPATPRAGLAVHAVFGRVGEPAVLRALTAIVAAGLSERATVRAADGGARAIAGVGAGLSLPFSLGAGPLRASGAATLELFGLDLAGPPAASPRRPLHVHLALRRADGWLVGGPGGDGGQDLRWLEANISLPLGSGGEASAELILHEARIFSLVRRRWVVSGAARAQAMPDAATPALPEVGVLLSGVMRELSAETDAGIASLLDLLEAVGLFSRSASGSGGGLVATALNSLLNQPAAHVRGVVESAASRARLQTALDRLLTPLPGVSVDLASGRAAVALSGAGALPWAVDAFVDTSGGHGGTLTLGSPGARLELTLDPLAASLELANPGRPVPDVVPLWPAVDMSALTARLPAALIANSARLGLDHLRRLDDGARPVIDSALDALGLLSGAPADVERRVLVPAMMLSHPGSWLRSAGALGGPGDVLAPARVVALVEALKPILGLSGGTGEMQLAPGVALVASDSAGLLRLGLSIDGSAIAPSRLGFGGTLSLEVASGGGVRPLVDLFAGLPGAGGGRQAVHLAVDGGVRLFVRPQTGADIALYPDPPGLGALTGAALRVLPLALDELAGATAPPPLAEVARIVRAIGDALDLRSGAPAKFDPVKLDHWAADPAQRFAERMPLLAQASLAELASAIGPRLPAGVAVATTSGRLEIAAGPVAIGIGTAPFAATVAIDAAGLPFFDQVDASIGFDASGLAAFAARVGPVQIPVNGMTLRPFLAFAAGPAAPGGARVETGVALDGTAGETIFARWNVGAGGFALFAGNAGVDSSDPGEVGLALARLTLDIVARFALETAAVQTLLNRPTAPFTTAPGHRIRALFRGVLLEDTSSPSAIDPTLLDPARMLGRTMRLLRNTAEAGFSFQVKPGLSIGARLDGNLVSATLGVTGRVELNGGDVIVSLEADTRWITTHPAPGIELDLLDISGPVFRPGLKVHGLGIRVSRASAPLVDSVFKLGSVALHVFADLSAASRSGGAQLQLSDLAVSAGGASGGGNAVAQGIMADSDSGSQKLAPAFSPALAVQKHGSAPVVVSLSAGEGDGPWWLSIQRAVGPLYVEQVGLGVTKRQDRPERISVLFDGRVSIAGLTAAVDDLQIGFTIESNASPFDPSRWTIDLAGLAVSADMSGLVLSGGLRKFGAEPDIEYIGMLNARVAIYGLSIYGGYGTSTDDRGRFAAFFAFGAVTGPIGGPPAFFVTGIGGGLGINRDLIFPQNLQTFGDFVMIKALDPAAGASPNPMAELERVRASFPMRRDRFWFAAGLSFTSFALVDGIAVVAVSVGGGFELSLLGLARLALPRPQLRLVSIELGLLARFSTRDGVMWIQAELTENSWLLHESVRLTGGFAYVMWFSGPRAGEFVLTLGGYHPSFHRDGYPVVPRLGFRWQIGDTISIKGENYFALTSEAVMAGGGFEASAQLGPAWANVSFGANAIIYFDPFRYEADAHARISAGVTVDLWLGEVSFSVSLGAQIAVAGPEFHGSVTFEIGPVDVTFAFGATQQTAYEYLSWDAFAIKYLEAAGPGVARVLTAVPGKGALPPGTGGNGEEKGTSDGSAEKPFEVLSEFELIVTTAAPATSLLAGTARHTRAPTHLLGIGPIGASKMTSEISLKLFRAAQIGGTDSMQALRLARLSTGAFPLGAWGPVQSRENKKVPKGDVVDALNGGLFASEAAIEGTIPAEIAFNQVEAGPRKPLPFLSERSDRLRVAAEGQALGSLIPPDLTTASAFATAADWLPRAGNSALALASLRGERAAPPRLGALGERLASAVPTAEVRLAAPDPVEPPDLTVHPPRVVAVLAPSARGEVKRQRMTVEDRRLPRVAAPTLAAAEALLDGPVAARLLRIAPAAAIGMTTMVSARTPPLTRSARVPAAAVAWRGSDAGSSRRLKAMTAAVAGRASEGERQVMPGEVAVLAMPNARRDSGEGGRPSLRWSGEARLVMLGAGGEVVAEAEGDRGAAEIPRGTERVAVWAGGGSAALCGMAGWHDGQTLPYIGWSTCLARGAVVTAEGATLRRGEESFTAGWIGAREFVAGARLVTSRFAIAATVLVLALDENAPGDPTAEFTLAVDGAQVATDSEGREARPVLLGSGARRLLVYALVPDGAGPVTVKVQRDGTIALAGMMASEGDPAVVAALLAEQPADALLDTAPAAGTGPVSIRFAPGRPPRTVRDRNPLPATPEIG